MQSIIIAIDFYIDMMPYQHNPILDCFLAASSHRPLALSPNVLMSQTLVLLPAANVALRPQTMYMVSRQRENDSNDNSKRSGDR